MSTILERIILDATFLSISSTAFDVQKLSIQKGQRVKINASQLPEGHKISWFANNDQVLEIQENNNSAIITAAQAGSSTIELQIRGVTIRKIDVIVTQQVATRVSFKVEGPFKQ